MEYPGSMMSYPSHGNDMSAPPMNRGRGGPKSRGQRNNAYRSKKHPRNASHGDTSGACFNCGSTDHWAPQCPGNSREHHPGGHTNPNQAKRQKTHRFGPGQQFYGGPHFGPQPPYDYGNPPMSNPDYDYMPMDRGYDRSMPNTASQQPFGRWQQPPPPHPREGYPYPAYSPQDVPPPMPSHSQPYSGPPPSHGHGYFPRDYHQPFPGGPDYYHQYRPDPHQHPPQDHRRRQYSKTWKRTDNTQNSLPPPEPWTGEPGPRDSEENSRGGHIVWKPAMQIARPLPSILDERDDMGSLPPATSLPRGMSVSKYILDRPLEEFCCNIRETEDWPFMMSDPIFMDVSPESEMIPVEELISRRNKIFETHKVPVKSNTPGRDANEEEARTEDDYEQVSRNNSFDGSGGEHGEHSPANPDRDSPSAEPEQSEPVHEPSPRPHTDSPSDEPNGQVPGPKLEQSDEDNHESDDRDNHSEQRPLQSHLRNGVQGPGPGKQSRWRRNVNQPPKKQQHSFERRFNPANKPWQHGQRDTGSHPFNGQKIKSNSPNRPGSPAASYNRRGSESHDSADVKDVKGLSTPLETGKEQGHSGSTDQKPHDQSNHDNHNHSNKNERAPNTNDEPRRQKDDTAPKAKQRQPRVAEAYSRRW